MKGRFARRWLALGLTLALLLAPEVCGALAETGEVFAEAVETEVQEIEIYLGESEVAAPEIATPEGDPVAAGEPEIVAPEGESEVAAPEGDPAEATEPEPAPIEDGPRTQVVDALIAVDTETWQDVNLVRAEGYADKIARVDGTLTLSGVQVDGQPVTTGNLADYFTLGPKGGIVVADDAPLALNLSAFSFNKGSKKTLSLQWNGAALAAKKAKWKSSNSKIFSVSSSGKLTAKKKGVATLTVTYKGEKARCWVVVTDIKQVKSVKLNKSKLTLSLYGTAQLKATVKPSDAADKTLRWTSSKPEVVSVDENGVIAGLAGGSAKIKAISANGKTATCTVTVKEVKPKSLEFAAPWVTLNPGGAYALQVKLSPANASNPYVLYGSSDPSVAVVDEQGAVTAVGCGTAIITAFAAAKTSVQASCRVCVVEPGAGRLTGLTIGINPGHQTTTIKKKYPIAPGSKKTAYGCKVGACGKFTRVNEYETTLQVGLKLARILTEQGATVVMTRTTNDVSLTNIERAKILNDAGVDLALQLHCDSVSNTKKEGVQSFVRDNSSWAKESKAMGAALTKAISAVTGAKNLGVKVNNGYMSLNWTTTPSVLLEMGFISNKKEDMLLATDEYRELMAQGICEGICAYFGR